ncbi:MAG: undecaprenyldiphospho-muramoylpentapeptide beta-N-acetylglucosaminyltransferase [Flavobacteriia bacterium]|jgi:UDP-N-acetylglucosamine--N-acetylmuramyl-(pentapeptide) pyrophosphoryl-undecaprenol N-acetylglucosamine transferase|nr:undecaprenyldiphospho-muramoylpentapeptide beta-N-acetylglucosaminyltransferase [Cryomorphaceae bacterium]
MSVNRVVISGGGTGGHIFPAVAIADEIKRRNPNAEILFVGALGKMEMEKVPAAGYKIVGLSIAGFQRKLTFSNFLLPFKIIGSLLKARKLLKDFKPEVVIGVGGYASGPTLKAATYLKIPTLIQEQNGFPGKTNKLLAKSVHSICTAYDGLERFFPKEKILLTGNPVRKEMVDIANKRDEACAFYHMDSTKPIVLIIGGSLGAKTLNRSVVNAYEALIKSDVQVLWQSGKLYYSELKAELAEQDAENIHLVEFIERMDFAYAMADLIVSRAGAISVSELCIIGKPVILVPSPNVAEDHQTKNAMALVEKNAAILIKDVDAPSQLINDTLHLLKDKAKCESLSTAIYALGKPNATSDIVDEVERIIK